MQPDTIPQVVQEIVGGQALSLFEAAREMPRRNGKAVHCSTVVRWVLNGVKVGGRVVKLEAGKIGLRWMTSRSALARFVASTSPSSNAAPTTKIDRSKRVAAARRELAAAGV